MKENGSTKKARSRRYLIEFISDVDYADDLPLITNGPSHAKSLLHSLGQAARGISLYVNSDKTELMCFNHYDAISSLNGKPLKLLDQFIYFGGNISFYWKRCKDTHR